MCIAYYICATSCLLSWYTCFEHFFWEKQAKNWAQPSAFCACNIVWNNMLNNWWSRRNWTSISSASKAGFQAPYKQQCMVEKKQLQLNVSSGDLNFLSVAINERFTYLTDKEKSPGVLSLSLMRKAPSWGCLDRVSSAFALVIRPWYQLQRRKRGGGQSGEKAQNV